MIHRVVLTVEGHVNATDSPPRQRPTRRQLEVLRAYIRAGSVAAAAYELGISGTTVRRYLSGLYGRVGCLNAAQAAYWLGKADSQGDDPDPTWRADRRARGTTGARPRCKGLAL
jgi:DNA-binding NarL/FixJ family response regulator